MKAFLLVCMLVSSVVGYNILCFHPIPSKSHFQLVTGIVKPLLQAGHQVTFATVYPEAVKEKSKNLKLIDMSHNLKYLDGMDMSNPNISITEIKAMARSLSLSLATTPAVRNAIVKEKFDAVVTEWFFTDIDSGYAAVMQVPWIMLSSNVIHSHIEELVGASRTISTVPCLHTNFAVPMNFWQRLANTFFTVMMTLDEWGSHSMYKNDYEVNFGPLAAARGITLPPYEDIRSNVSIVLSNSHPSIAQARNLPPNVIEIGGYHIDANIPTLQKDLQDILDSSPQGVIYFSMGSVLKHTVFQDEVRKYLIEMFGNLTQTVLWKFEEKIENLPKNVHVRPWMPQSSILAHPNVKVFITHGGLLSTMESLQYGVPLLSIPVFGDQPNNAARNVQNGYALKVDYSPKMGPQVKVALEEMLKNDSYQKKAQYVSKLFKNRPQKPSELITYYIEMAIETKGAPHLRSVNKAYKWYEFWMLDQLLFVSVILYVIYSVLKKIICALTRQEPKKTSRKKKE